MLIYAVSAVRLNRDQTRITDVLWQQLGGSHPIDYQPTEAPVIEVVEVLTAGNKVFLIVQDESGTWINTYAEFKPVSYPYEEVGIINNEYALGDLPIF